MLALIGHNPQWRGTPQHRQSQDSPVPHGLHSPKEIVEASTPVHVPAHLHRSPVFSQTTIVSMLYDVVVIGGGHAGCEAARACARLGLRTAMITMNADLIAQMSCNPAIGGIAKGHLVREIDALGGVMGEVTDAVGIQFRLLNTSRGPAVWSPRAQCDKKQYRLRMREVLEREPNLRILQAEVAELNLSEAGASACQRVTGVLLRDGRTISSDAVIITTGTLLKALPHTAP